MQTSLIEWLKSSRVFSSLDEEAARRLLAKSTEIELNQHDVLFYQGDPSHSVYLLLSGKCVATLTTAFAEKKMVGYIEAHETVGELGAIANEPRSLTVTALKDSTLLQISAQDFIEVCHRYPAVMFATLHPIIARSSNLIEIISTKQKSNKHVVILPANSTILLAEFSHAISAYAGKFQNLLIISDYDSEIGEWAADKQQMKDKIQQAIKDRNVPAKILYILRSPTTTLGKLALRKAGTIYIVGSSESAPVIDQAVLATIQARRLHMVCDPILVLLHPKNTQIPEQSAAWLLQTDFSLHHHLRADNLKDLQRLMRFIRGKAVGLVLGGGGTRGWAHLGVIKALRKTKTPIDIIGGTSVGAMVAACYAIERSYQGAYDKFSQIITGSAHSISWRSLTWPIVSLFNAKRFTQSQINAFNEMRIENLWLPYFCVSSNLSKAREEVHRAGLVWEKVRASTSIPGLVPPMLLQDDMHFDGGLLNNLPVDVMRQLVGNKGKVIAVELNSFAPSKRKYAFPPMLTFTEFLLAKLGLSEYQYKFPRFLDTFLRGVFMSSFTKTRQNSLAANIFINLDLSKFRLLNSNLKQAQGLVDIGYNEALKQIQPK